MNSVSIEKMVDVELWQGLLETFNVRSQAPDWLIEPVEKPKRLTAKEFYELAMSTEDEREINAIALFMWMQNFKFDEFAFRCVDRIAESGKFAIIQEAMLYRVGPFGDNEEVLEVLRNSLTREKRENVLEAVLSIFALGEAEDTLMRLLLERVCVYLEREMQDFNWVRDAKILRGVLPFVESVKFALPEFCSVLVSYSKRMPKNNSKNFKICDAMGMDYFKQLILAYRLQETRNQWEVRELSDIAGLLVAHLGLRASKWAEDEKVLLKEIVGKSKEKGLPVVNVENLRWAVGQGWIGVFTADLRFSGVAEFLEPYQRASIVAMVSNSLEDANDSRIAEMCRKHTKVLDVLFSQWEEGLVKSYEKVRRHHKYSVFEANFLSNWEEPEAAKELLKEIKGDRESVAYRLLMEGLREQREALKDEEIAEEAKIFCLMYHPGETVVENDEEDEENEYWEEDGYEE